MMIRRAGGLRGNGFTLVELMVAVTLSFVATIGIYKGYVSFVMAVNVQEQALELNQNLRVGMNQLVRDIRMAGFVDPAKSPENGAGFLLAAANSLQITRDLYGGDSDAIDNDKDGLVDEPDEANFSDGDINDNYEDIVYLLSGPNANGSFDLMREDKNGATDTIIENVDGLNFVYLGEDGKTLAVPANGTHVSTTPNVSGREQIRAVEISLIVRTTNEDYSFTDRNIYRNLQDANNDGDNDVVFPAPEDNFHRQILSAKVKCRNLGLK